MFLIVVTLLLSRNAAASDWESITAPSNKIATVEVTPEGLIAGEFDDRMWLNPYNGLYLSGDSGSNWTRIGLQGKGIKVLKYKNGELFAGAFYTTSTPGGLYVSSYPYSEWEHLGPAYNITSVDACENHIYMGTRYYGLMVSPDGGVNWSQKIEPWVEEPEIVALFCHERTVLASTKTSVFLSKDSGETWVDLDVFAGATIYSFTKNNKYIAASGTGYEGVFISPDGGENWAKEDIPGLRTSRKVLFQGQYLYTVSGNDVLADLERGKNPESTSLPEQNPVDIMDLEAYKPSSYNLVALNASGKIFRKSVDGYLHLPLLDSPWELLNEWDLSEKINSYFDHQYPLLAYRYLNEPGENSRTTLMYDGVEGSIPALYYSSHSGIDFDAEYGDSVLASAGGDASYYYCKDCGNTIKIDHGNGTQTIYMHLQNNPLVQGNTVVRVNNRDEIGKVGLTGRTTGPHLHFETVSDTDGDGLFSDEYPHGRTDPFGWDYSKLTDPWSEFSWNDSLGAHAGTFSKNLWKSLSTVKQSTPLVNTGTLTLGNKVIEIINDAGKNFLQLTLEHAPRPLRDFPTATSQYVPGTAFIINLADQLGNISAAEAVVRARITISPEVLIGFLPETIKIFRWDDTAASWIETISSYDSVSETVEGVLNHFSYFAAFGEKYDPEIIFTQINISPESVEGTVDIFPTISFSGNGALTVYSLNGGNTWNSYDQPVTINEQGLFDILYKSEDASGNWEETKSFVLKVGAAFITNKIRIVGASFETLNDDSSP